MARTRVRVCSNRRQADVAPSVSLLAPGHRPGALANGSRTRRERRIECSGQSQKRLAEGAERPKNLCYRVERVETRCFPGLAARTGASLPAEYPVPAHWAGRFLCGGLRGWRPRKAFSLVCGEYTIGAKRAQASLLLPCHRDHVRDHPLQVELESEIVLRQFCHPASPRGSHPLLRSDGFGDMMGPVSVRFEDEGRRAAGARWTG
jgi:hypothetical protein